MTNMKPPQEGRNTGAPSLRGLQGRSATGLNGQAAKEEVSTMARGLDAGKYFWRSGKEKCFLLDIPFNRTSGPIQFPRSRNPAFEIAFAYHRVLRQADLSSAIWPGSGLLTIPEP